MVTEQGNLPIGIVIQGDHIIKIGISLNKIVLFLDGLNVLFVLFYFFWKLLLQGNGGIVSTEHFGAQSRHDVAEIMVQIGRLWRSVGLEERYSELIKDFLIFSLSRAEQL